MEIDLRTIQVIWISMSQDSTSSRRIQAMLQEAGFPRHRWSPGVSVKVEGAVSKERLYAASVALAHRKVLASHTSNEPLLLLEDDVAIEVNASMLFHAPRDADAVWVGISRYGKPVITRVNQEISAIRRVFSAHAVLYLVKSYINHAIQCIEQCLDCNLPFDIGLSFYQKDFKVYALNLPLFYQAKSSSSAHNFELLTRGPLNPCQKNHE